MEKVFNRIKIRASWGILNTSAFTLSIARIATFEFCLADPSMRNLLALGLDDLLNAFGKDLIISTNFGPVIVPSYCSQRTTPLPYDIATMKFTLIPPSFFPFAVQLNFKPSPRFLHSRAPGARAWS